MKLNLVYKLWLTLLLFTGSSMACLSEGSLQVVIEQTQDIDVCQNESERQVIVQVNIGEILEKDSLFGYNLILNYDASKIRFENILTQGTLTSLFQDKDMSIYPEVNQLYAWGAHINISLPPISGNKPLIAFLGYFKGNCPDTTMITVETLEFTEEFKKSVSKTVPATIVAKEKFKEDRKFEIFSQIDSLEIAASDSLATLNFKTKINQDARLSTFKADFSIPENSNFEIISSDPNLSLVDVISSTFTPVKHSYEFSAKGNVNNKELVEIKLKEIENLNSQFNLATTISEINDCSCISVVKNAEINIFSPKDTAVSRINENYFASSDDLTGYIYGWDGEIDLSSYGKITELKIFDLNGRLLISENNMNNDRLYLPKLPKGINFIRLQTIQKNIKKLILINN